MPGNGKIAVITGASSGIGQQLAHVFAAGGYDLIVTARREDRLQQLADEVGSAYGVTVSVIPMDVARHASGDALWQAIGAIAPRVDALVNNAGFGDSGDFVDHSPAKIERMIQLNISTLTLLTRHVLPGMVERKQGHILNVASLAGFQPGGPGMSVYYATKSYVLSFSRGLRSELQGTGVNVTALCPGPTKTEFEEAAEAQTTRLFRWMKPMAPQDVARAGYRGMCRGRAVVVPGAMNKLLAIGARFSPPDVALRLNRFLLARQG